MDRLYKVTEVRGEPMIACFKCQMREAIEVMEMRSLMMPMGRWREDEAGTTKSRCGRHHRGSWAAKWMGMLQEKESKGSIDRFIAVTGKLIRSVNYDDVPGAGGYHWFYDPFSVAHAAICVEEDDDVAGL
ncbi:hypothetical protein BHE74_00024955 [Ensete ventricosum]|nr:hypothetical protein BHE74_00024955 [Ensete ventricosum]